MYNHTNIFFLERNRPFFDIYIIGEVYHNDSVNSENYFKRWGDRLDDFKNTDTEFLIHSVAAKYYNDVYRLCRAHLKNKMDAEDCTQEVFAVFCQKSEKLTIGDEIKKWLYAVAKNKIKEYRRKNQDYNRSDIDIENLIDDEKLSYREIFFDDKDQSITDLLEQFTFLNKIEKEILVDFYQNQLDPDIIAKKHNMTLNAFYSRMTRIKAKLLKTLGENS